MVLVVRVVHFATWGVGQCVESFTLTILLPAPHPQTHKQTEGGAKPVGEPAFRCRFRRCYNARMTSERDKAKRRRSIMNRRKHPG